MASASGSGAPAAAEALRRRRILSSRLYLDDAPSSGSKVGHPSPIPSSATSIRCPWVVTTARALFAQAPVVYSAAYDISFNGMEKQ